MVKVKAKYIKNTYVWQYNNKPAYFFVKSTRQKDCMIKCRKV